MQNKTFFFIIHFSFLFKKTIIDRAKRRRNCNRISSRCCTRQRPHEDGGRQSGFHRAEGSLGRSKNHEELPLETRTGSLRRSAGLKSGKSGCFGTRFLFWDRFGIVLVSFWTNLHSHPLTP